MSQHPQAVPDRARGVVPRSPALDNERTDPIDPDRFKEWTPPLHTPRPAKYPTPVREDPETWPCQWGGVWKSE